MHLITAPDIPTAHQQIIDLIMSLPDDQVTENREIVKQLNEPLTVHIDNPKPAVVRGSLFGPKFCEKYVHKVCEITRRRNEGTDATYTYGNRLRDYPRTFLYRRTSEYPIIDRLLWRIGLVRKKNQYMPRNLGDGNGGGIDQVQGLIDRLKKNPNSRRAVAVTWYPEFDMNSPEPPCFDLVQAMVLEGRLNLVFFVRSNDMLSAWGMNAIGFSGLQKYIADALNISPGWIEIISNNPHIYYRRDAFELVQIYKARKQIP